MGEYRKKPVVIRAEHFVDNDREHMDALVRWMQFKNGTGRHDGVSIFIETPEGTARADVGDWIICGVKGEFYPCKPDIFEATYEPAEHPSITEGKS